MSENIEKQTPTREELVAAADVPLGCLESVPDPTPYYGHPSLADYANNTPKETGFALRIFEDNLGDRTYKCLVSKWYRDTKPWIEYIKQANHDNPHPIKVRKFSFSTAHEAARCFYELASNIWREREQRYSTKVINNPRQLVRAIVDDLMGLYHAINVLEIKAVIDIEQARAIAKLNNNGKKSQGEGTPQNIPNDLITTRIGVGKFHVSVLTLERAVLKGKIKSYRHPGSPPNATHLLRESELAIYYERRK